MNYNFSNNKGFFLKQLTVSVAIIMVFGVGVGLLLKAAVFQTIQYFTGVTPQDDLGLLITIPAIFFCSNVLLPIFLEACYEDKIPGIHYKA